MDTDEEIIKSSEFRMKNLEFRKVNALGNQNISQFEILNLRLKGASNGKTGDIIHGTMGGPVS